MDKLGSGGELIIDFSMYDAYLAGFKEVICIIKKEMEEDFKNIIEPRAGKHMNIRYAFQELGNLPEGYSVPEGREKPWGTCHAVLSAKHLIDGPFAVINADDYYGATAFQSIYDYLTESQKTGDGSKYHFCMAGYLVENTLTENGTVARGVCRTSDDENLSEIVERTKIGWQADGTIAYTEDEGETWEAVEKGTPVSMNFWGFTKDLISEMEEGFPKFLDEALVKNPLKGEYFLPLVVDQLIKSDRANVKVLKSPDRWYGVTYKEDRKTVVDALQSMKDKGLYPEILWK